MQVDDLILVSVDDHVVEPPHLFEGRLSAAAAERAPKLERLENGREVWMFEGSALPNVGLNAVAGRVPEEYGLDPLAFSQMRAGCFDIHERIRDMNVNGVLGSINFPSIAGFTGQLFMTMDDKDIAYELLRAYNDWHVEDWCGTYPGRMIPLAVPPSWDPQLMADEVRRMAAKGCHAVTFSENPEKLRLPSWHSPHWNPFLAACEETGTVICLHIGSSSTTVITAMDAPIDTMITLQPMNIVQCAADLIWSPVFRKFRNLRVALSEGGIGWVPYFLRIDYVYAPVDEPGLRRPPAERGVQRARAHLLHRRRRGHGGAPSPQPRPHPLGVRLPALRLDVAGGARAGDALPRRAPPRRHRSHHAPQRDAELPLRPLLGHPARAVHGGRAPSAGHRCRHGTREPRHRQVPGRRHRHGDDARRAHGEAVTATVGETPFRVLPVVDDDNRFFWTSGEDGLLRFLRCDDCGYWLHPPSPRCPECGGRRVAPQPVSGRGTIWSYTVNHHSWDGSTEPYAIVLVEFPEQHGLRLTTNLVGCPADAVHIDMPVRVVFEAHGSIWFPVVEPAAEEV
jgi:uncharacterized OB-fold protein/tryptophan-rich sensory protein